MRIFDLCVSGYFDFIYDYYRYLLLYDSYLRSFDLHFAPIYLFKTI